MQAAKPATYVDNLTLPRFRGHPARGHNASRSVHGEAAAQEFHGRVQGEDSAAREVEWQVGDVGGEGARPHGFVVAELGHASRRGR